MRHAMSPFGMPESLRLRYLDGDPRPTLPPNLPVTSLHAIDHAPRAAAVTAGRRMKEWAGGFAEASAYELARFYTILEKACERVCLAFENHVDKRHDYHERLLQQMTLDLPGIRPAFVPPSELPALRDLKGFRHAVRHAYDLTLRPNRLAELAVDAERLAATFPEWIKVFVTAVRHEQSWTGAP